MSADEIQAHAAALAEIDRLTTSLAVANATLSLRDPKFAVALLARNEAVAKADRIEAQLADTLAALDTATAAIAFHKLRHSQLLAEDVIKEKKCTVGAMMILRSHGIEFPIPA